MKLQSSVEFLLTYAWAFMAISIFLAFLLAVVTTSSPESFNTASCYISPEFSCISSIFTTNAISSKFVVIFINNLGQTITFPNNALTVIPSFTTKNYSGSCIPFNAVKGATVTCTAQIPVKISQVGSQINPKFNINYELCTPTCVYPIVSSNTINTTGYATIQVSPQSSTLVVNVTLADSPTSGNILVAGIRYPNNVVYPFIYNYQYNIYASPAPGYIFSNWITAGGVSVGSTSSQTTTAKANAIGTLTAGFITTSTSTSTSSTSSSTTSTSTSTTSTSTTTSTTTIFTAIGGNVAFSGGDEIHTFTTSGTFTVTGNSGNVQVLVVAGGGGGGGDCSNGAGGGGGGGGVVYASSYAVSNQAYSVTVGAGGAGGDSGVYPTCNSAAASRGALGSNSIFGTITANGGGGGGGNSAGGTNGGSGGGGGGDTASAGTANQGSSGGGTGYGNNGGTGGTGTGNNQEAGGGGGAGAAGGSGSTGSPSGSGGIGIQLPVSGSNAYYSGGGGGGAWNNAGAGSGGNGGGGGGGAHGVTGTSGTANTGGGGGGGGYNYPLGSNDFGGTGGSGIIIIRFNALGNGTPGVTTSTSTTSTTTTIEYVFCVAGVNNGADSTNVYYAPLYQTGGVGSWTSTNSYGVATDSHACTAYGGYVYCSGGGVTSSYSARLTTGGTTTWSSTTALPTASYDSSVHCVNNGGYMYCIQGDQSGGCSAGLDFYATIGSGTIGSWSSTTSYPICDYSATCVNNGGTVYCTTGTTFPYPTYVGNSYGATLSSGGIGSWTTGATKTTPGPYGSCVYYSGYIYCVGGYPGSYTNAVESASVTGTTINSWASTNAYPINIYENSCVTYNGYIDCVGGYTGATSLASVYYGALSSGVVTAWTTTNAYPANVYAESCVIGPG